MIFIRLFYIIEQLIELNKLKDNHTEAVFIKMHKFIKLYNNNYRPIYHLETLYSIYVYKYNLIMKKL